MRPESGAQYRYGIIKKENTRESALNSRDSVNDIVSLNAVSLGLVGGIDQLL
jgi:hypothetical protein